MPPKSPNTVLCWATSHRLMKIFCSFGSSRPLMRFCWKIEDWPTLIRISGMVLLLGPCWRSMPIIRFWKEWRPYALRMRITSQMRTPCVRLWNRLGSWTMWCPEIFTAPPKDKCYFSFLTCTFTCPSTCQSKNRSYSSAFWESKWQETSNSQILQQNLWFMRSNIKVQMTSNWWESVNSVSNPKRHTSMKWSSYHESAQKFAVASCSSMLKKTHLLLRH